MEELDWFGNYLDEGLFFGSGDYAKMDMMSVGDFAGPINNYYESQHDPRLPAQPKPKQNLPAEIEALILQLEESGTPGFVNAVCALLEGNGEARARLAQGIAEGERKARLTGYFGFRIQLGPMMLALRFMRSTLAQSEVDRYTRAAKYLAKSDYAVGIAKQVGPKEAVLVSVLDQPWAEDRAEEALARDVFKGLSVREERNRTSSDNG